jgi:E3 ubiquitin-protein ligase RNF38/44
VLGSSSSSVGAVPTIHGSSGAAIFANSGYAPSSVHAGTAPIYPNPAPATSSGSRTMLHQVVTQSHPPATSAATSASMRIAQPLPARTAVASRHARHVSAAIANNGRYRRARSSYYSLHPLMVEAEVDSFFFPCFNEVKLVLL